jgi:phage shock protein E
VVFLDRTACVVLILQGKPEKTGNEMNFFSKLVQGITGGSTQDLPQNAILIDVRSPGEFAAGYIDGAISLPLDTIGQTIGASVPDKSAAIIVYCRSGARSASAKNILTGLGYQHVINGGGVGGLALKLQKAVHRG